MSLTSKENSNNNNTQNVENKILVCPNAPRITKKPIQKKIIPINVIEDSDSSYYEEQKENQKVKVAEYKKDSEDDRYKSSDESYDEDFYAERETQSQSAGIKSGLKKFKEDISESVS